MSVSRSPNKKGIRYMSMVMIGVFVVTFLACLLAAFVELEAA